MSHDHHVVSVDHMVMEVTMLAINKHCLCLKTKQKMKSPFPTASIQSLYIEEIEWPIS